MTEQRRVGAVQALRLAALLELAEHRDRRRDLDRELLAGVRADLDARVSVPFRPSAATAATGPKTCDERRDVVRAHVEQRSAAAGVEEGGVRVEDLRTLPLEDVCANSGRPMSPRAIARFAVWMPGPSTVSGATPTRRPAASAFSSSPSDDSRSTPIGFSVHTCLPAAMIASRDLDVHGRDREVDDDLDVGVCRARRRLRPMAGTPYFSACVAARSSSRSPIASTRTSGNS